MKTTAIQLQPRLQPIAAVPKIWYFVGMDLIGPFTPSHEGFKFA